MVMMNRREMAQMARTLGSVGVAEIVRECLELGREGKPGGLKPEDFSLKDCAEALVENGAEWVRSMDPRRDALMVTESSSALDTTAFRNVTSQFLYSKLLEGYNGPENLFSRLIRTEPTRLRYERMRGVSGFGSEMPEVHEGMPFPMTELTEAYTETPLTTKRGEILGLTKELVFFDQTGQVLTRALQLGEKLIKDKERRIVRVLIGSVNNYSRNGTTYNTYLTTGAWINDHSNPLVDWTDIDQASLLFADMRDPETNEPIEIMPRHLIVSPKRHHTARMIINSTEVQTNTQTAAIRTVAANPVAGAYEIYKSIRMYQQLQSELGLTAEQAAEYWFLGDVSKALTYMENWPLTPVQAPVNSEAEFNQDIIYRMKVSEMGVAAATEPRQMVRNKN